MTSPGRVAFAMAAALLAGCAAQGDETVLDPGSPDASVTRVTDSARPIDGPADVGPADVGAADVGAEVAFDAGFDARFEVGLADAPPEVGPAETGPAPDARPPCAPTRTSCNAALECGAIPNGCPGGVFRCGECSGGETWCASATSRWQTRVYNCTQRAQGDHPEWFDAVMFRDTSSWLALEASAGAYVTAVAQCADGRGAVAIVDRNAPGNEVRVRGTDDDLAENFIVRTYSTGRTAGRYTSACTPAGY